MFRVAICDDLEEQLKIVHESVERFFNAHEISSFEIKEYNDPNILLPDSEQNWDWDIVLLDVCMPGMLGIDVAKRIKEKSEKTKFIFLSVSREFAIDAFAVNASHYLLKPFTPEEFDEAMNRAIGPLIANEAKKIMLQMENGAIHSTDITDIIFIESMGYRRLVHTKDGVYEETKRPLSKMLSDLEELSPGQFITPYRGYIVNLDAIKAITNDRVVLHNGESILIKRGDFRRLKDILFKWAFRSN